MEVEPADVSGFLSRRRAAVPACVLRLVSALALSSQRTDLYSQPRELLDESCTRVLLLMSCISSSLDHHRLFSPVRNRRLCGEILRDVASPSIAIATGNRQRPGTQRFGPETQHRLRLRR